jgi:hypothetical protein
MRAVAGDGISSTRLRVYYISGTFILWFTQEVYISGSCVVHCIKTFLDSKGTGIFGSISLLTDIILTH